MQLFAKKMLVAAGLFVFSLPCSANAAVIFYGGNPVSGGALEDQIDNSGVKLTVVGYDNFFVPAGGTYTINDVFGEFGLPVGSAFGDAVYEIRTGMNNGAGGVLLASDELPVTITPGVGGPINGSNPGLPPQRVQVNLPVPLVLTGGLTGVNYWIGLAPDTTGNSFNTFLGTTGANSPTGVNLPPTQTAFEHQIYTNPVTQQPVDQFIAGPYTSIGLDGTRIVVPEPATAALAVAGLIVASANRRRRGGNYQRIE
ncbi:MAG TPA: PEP-CTERM sorting domain-containing protein [Lacipirellulaceae bacterium]|jgi:hypothetical protein|nr:PEP-CTERM sorting domain-containing protein [Lacipirellulaceae bacterium]